MMLSFYGYNELARKLPDDLLVAINPAVHLTFDAARASHVCDLLPECEVYYRSWTPHPNSGDDNLSTLRPGDQYYTEPIARAEFMHAACPDPRVWLIPENEPLEEINPVRHVDWQLKCAGRLLQLGRKVGVGKYGPGHPIATRETDRGHVVDWQGALWPLAQFADDNPARVRMILDEYIFHHDLRYGYDAAWNRYWYAGRGWMLLDEFPNLIAMLGECGTDDDDPRYKGPFDDPKAPDKAVLSAEAHNALLIDAYRTLYAEHPRIVGGALFAYGTIGPNDKWWAWDMARVSHETLLHLASETRKQEGEPVDLTNRERVRVRPKATYTNIRAGAGLDHAIVAKLEGPRYAMRTVDTENASGYDWRHYEFEDGAPAGWLADGVVVAEPQPLPIPPEEPPPPEPPATPDPMTPEKWLALLTAWEATTAQMINALTDAEAGLVAFRAVLVETIGELDEGAA